MPFFVVNLQDEPVRLRMKINAAVKKPPQTSAKSRYDFAEKYRNGGEALS